MADYATTYYVELHGRIPFTRVSSGQTLCAGQDEIRPDSAAVMELEWLKGGGSGDEHS
jgi:hypothetical protein